MQLSKSELLLVVVVSLFFGVVAKASPHARLFLQFCVVILIGQLVINKLEEIRKHLEDLVNKNKE